MVELDRIQWVWLMFSTTISVLWVLVSVSQTTKLCLLPKLRSIILDWIFSYSMIELLFKRQSKWFFTLWLILYALFNTVNTSMSHLAHILQILCLKYIVGKQLSVMAIAYIWESLGLLPAFKHKLKGIFCLFVMVLWFLLDSLWSVAIG